MPRGQKKNGNEEKMGMRKKQEKKVSFVLFCFRFFSFTTGCKLHFRTKSFPKRVRNFLNCFYIYFTATSSTRIIKSVWISN